MPEDSPSIYTIMAERVANAILGKINALIGSHNTNEQAHQDIRNTIINESTYSVKTLYSLSGSSSSFDFSSVTDTHFQSFQTPIFVLARNTIGDNTANATIKVTNSGNTYPILDNTGGTISGYIGNGVWKKNSWGLFFIPPSAPSQLYNVFTDIDEVYNSLYSYLGIKGVYTVNSVNQSNSSKTVYTTDPLLNGNLIGNDEFIIIVNSYETNTDKNVYINHLQGSTPLRQSKNDLKESDVNGCLLRCAYSGGVIQVSNISTNTKLIPLFSDLSAVAQTGNYDHLINKPNIPSKTSDLTNDNDFITSSSVPNASSVTPSADTTNGSVGTGTAWARSDHTHPKSSLYAESIHEHGIEDTNLLNVLDYVNNNFDNFNGEIVFLDDCSSDMSSQYDVKGYIQEGTYPITQQIDITYNDGDEEPCYILYPRANGRESFSWFAIPNLRGLDNIRITATCSLYDYGLYSQIFLGLCDTLEQTDSSNYKFDFVSIKGDEKFDAVKNNIEQFSNNVNDVNNVIVKLVFERIGNNITGKVYNEDGTALLSWNSYTTTNEYDNPYYFLGLMSRYGYYYGLYELKAEQLII